MAEYIERHRLRLQFQHEHIVNSTMKDHKTARAWEGALMLLEDAPTADVVEVRHGKWVRRDAILFDNEVVWYKCSECNTTWGVRNNYCPNCGAKMDGKGADNGTGKT